MPLPAFVSVHLISALAFLALALGGLWAWALPVVVFGLIPLCELFLPSSRQNLSAEQEATRRRDRRYDWLLYAVVPVQLGLLLLLGLRAPALAPLDLAGAVLSVGVSFGALGFNVGHELGHRADRRDQLLAKILFATNLYGHFFVEHNRGHHATVATPEDPASARRGEWIFPFWARSVVGGLQSAWRIEATRLGRKGRSAWSWDNELVPLFAGQAAALIAFFAVFGPVAGLAWIGVALVAVLLLETINYVEHYGLARERTAEGRWERVRPAHSWTSDRPISRALLFELTRHADHHANPGRPYPILRHFAEAPELPAGYPAMVVLALLPPLFFAVMDRHLDTEEGRLAAMAPRAAVS